MELVAEKYKKTDVGIIPIDWDVKALGAFSIISSGGTPNRKEPTYWKGNIPWVTTSQINFNTIDKANQFITEAGLNNSAAKVFKAGTLLMAMYGQGKTRGKIAILGIDATTNQACAAISLNKEVVKEYIFCNLSGRYDEIRNLSNTGNQENLNGDLIKKILIPLPPTKTEQIAIATALSDIDNLISSLEKFIAKKRQIKQGAMQKLLQPKAGWVERKLNDEGVTELVTCGIAATPKYVSEAKGFPFLSSTNVKSGKIQWSNYKFIPKILHEQLYRNNPPVKGDVLYSRVGTIGEAAIVDVNFQFSIYVSLTLIKVGKLLHNQFLVHLLNSSRYKKMANNTVLMGGGVGNLNVSVVRAFPIPIPPINEQITIANILSDIDAEIIALETKLEKYRKIKSGMMQNLLTGKTRLV